MKVAIGQDSHKFDFNKETNTELILGGVVFESEIPMHANSDGDVILHAITNSISGITGVNILGSIADGMCQNGITDSKEYLKEALKYLHNSIVHLSICVECKVPKISHKIEQIKECISSILNIPTTSIGITATTGEGLTEFGKGNGISVFVCITVD